MVLARVKKKVSRVEKRCDGGLERELFCCGGTRCWQKILDAGGRVREAVKV